MSKYELTISSNYVKHWGVWEGVREFFQNAIDEENSNPDHKMLWKYEDGCLTIINRNCKLSINSLLLGNTSKSDGKSIGQFGEGYKVAIVVLLREGKKITIHNGDELWNVRFVNSRRYKDQVPVIETSKFGIIGSDLIIEIEGITEEEWEEITNNILQIRETIYGVDPDQVDTEYGSILPDMPGRIYVEGLYISTKESLKYGYNFKSYTCTLNRDRNILSDFEITWNASRIGCTAFQNKNDKLFEFLDLPDGDYAQHFISKNSKDELYEIFKEKNGSKIPVTSQEEYDYFKHKGMEPVFVKETVKTIFSSYFPTEMKNYNTETSLYYKLSDLYERMCDYLPDDLAEEFYDYLNNYEDDLKEIKIIDE